MIHIAITEDEAACARQLKQYLQAFQKEYNQELEISVFPNGNALLAKYRRQYDLLLLDIEMPGMDGMQTAEQIRKQDQEVEILFITNMAQYAIRGYEVAALDYILKPVSYFAFSQRLNRALSRIRRRKKQYVVITVKGGTQKLATDDIYYVESQGHNLIYHTATGNYVTVGTMRNIEEKLLDLDFFRCNKGYLVSLKHVDGILNGCAVIHGEQLLISRGRKAEFLDALANFIGGVTL